MKIGYGSTYIRRLNRHVDVFGSPLLLHVFLALVTAVSAVAVAAVAAAAVGLLVKEEVVAVLDSFYHLKKNNGQEGKTLVVVMKYYDLYA